MRSFWSDPYLWIHLAGIAAAPLWLELCFLGLAVGDPVLPFWLELLLVAAVGIAPILWMQWQRPFYIFSLVALAQKPEQLSDDQRRLLTLFKTPRNRVAAVALAIALFALLYQLYAIAPIAAAVTPFATQPHLVGLGIAAIAFLVANLFCQVPLSVLSVLLTRQATFNATVPCPPEQIRRQFTRIGFPVKQILPPFATQSAESSPAPGSAQPENSAQFTPETESPQPDSVPTELKEIAGESEEVPSPNPDSSEIAESLGLATDICTDPESALVESPATESPATESPAADRPPSTESS